MIWFTSDLHFFHDRILEFHPKRKEIFGSTVEKAKEAMIQLWNSRVNKKDTIYILGDLAFSFIGNLYGSLLCTYIDRYEAKKNKKKENDKSES